jgi:hypothetical protein
MTVSDQTVPGRRGMGLLVWVLSPMDELGRWTDRRFGDRGLLQALVARRFWREK